MTTRQEYYEQFAARLEELKAELKVFKAQAETAATDAKVKINAEVEHLRARQEELEVQLSKLRKTSDEAWKELKLGIELAWKDLSEGIAAARKRFD